MIHGKVEDLVEIRQSDDLFVLAIEESARFSKEDVVKELISEGAINIKEREYIK
jgi:hypothetical protein